MGREIFVLNSFDFQFDVRKFRGCRIHFSIEVIEVAVIEVAVIEVVVLGLVLELVTAQEECARNWSC